MWGIIQRPSVVKEAVEQFADLFANQCQRKHFGNYLIDLMVGRNKNVTGMTNEIVNAKDQSLSQAVFQQAPLTEVDSDEKKIDEERIQWRWTPENGEAPNFDPPPPKKRKRSRTLSPHG